MSHLKKSSTPASLIVSRLNGYLSLHLRSSGVSAQLLCPEVLTTPPYITTPLPLSSVSIFIWDKSPGQTEQTEWLTDHPLLSQTSSMHPPDISISSWVVNYRTYLCLRVVTGCSVSVHTQVSVSRSLPAFNWKGQFYIFLLNVLVWRFIAF